MKEKFPIRLNAGGVSFAGYAICGGHKCNNNLVTSEAPPSLNTPPYDPEYIGWITLHEVGHALGLGHSTTRLESTDLMGYGWADLADSVLSDCDIDCYASSSRGFLKAAICILRRRSVRLLFGLIMSRRLRDTLERPEVFLSNVKGKKL